MTDTIQLLQFLVVCGVEIDSKYKNIHLETAQTEKPKLISSYCFNESSNKKYEKVLEMFQQLDIYSKVFPMDINFWNRLMVDEIKIIKNLNNYIKIGDKTLTPIFHCFNQRVLDNDEEYELFFHCYLFWDEIERKVFKGTLKREIKKIAIPKAVILVTFEPCFNFCQLLLSTLSQQQGIADPVHFFSKLHKSLTINKGKVNNINIKIISGITINIDYQLFYNPFFPLCDINLDFMFKLFKLNEILHLLQILLEGELFIVISNDLTVLYPIYYCLTLLIHPLEATNMNYNFNLLSPLTSTILYSQLNFLTQSEKASLFVYTTAANYDEYFLKLAQNKTYPINIIQVIRFDENNYTTKIHKYYNMQSIEYYDKEYHSKMEIECLNENNGRNMSSFSEIEDTLSLDIVFTFTKSEEIQIAPVENSYRTSSRKSAKTTQMPPIMRRRVHFRSFYFDYCLRKNKLFFMKIYQKLQGYFEVARKGPNSFFDGKSKNFLPIQNLFFKLNLFIFLSINYQVKYNRDYFPQLSHSYDKNFNRVNLALFTKIQQNNLLDISKPLINHNYEDLVLLYSIINYHNDKKILDCDFLNTEQFDINLSLNNEWMNNHGNDSFFHSFVNTLHKINQKRIQNENSNESQEQKNMRKTKLFLEKDNLIMMSEIKLIYLFYKSDIIQIKDIEQKEMTIAKFLYCFVYSLFLLNKVNFSNDFDQDATFKKIFKFIIESNGFKDNFNFIISFILIIISSNKNYENPYLTKLKTFLFENDNFSPSQLKILKQRKVNESILEKEIEIKPSKILSYWLSDESAHIHSNFNQVYIDFDKFCFFCDICQKELFLVTELREGNAIIKIKKPSDLIEKILYQLIKKGNIYFPIKDEDSLFDYEDWKNDYLLINFYGNFLQTLTENESNDNDNNIWEKVNIDNINF